LCGLSGIIGFVDSYFDINKLKSGEKVKTTPKPSVTQKVTVKTPTSLSTPLPTTSTPLANTTSTPTATAAGITLANFNRIKNGMKYEEVVAILRTEGEVLSEKEFVCID